MNTTELIRHWSIGGADGDITARFRSGTEAITPRTHEDQPMPEHGGLLVKQADSDAWTPLAVDAS